ncbi:MAG: J domain-containing protein [Deltaproteobacteria bacterium]|nr:J domain-containing protein [Deltaproteobacteria bacterium]
MNITKSYKTLDLKTGASINDVRKAYKDMVRVWHPDRFADNIRLRAKANEKLKEINLAYSEIKKFWAKDCRVVPSDTEKTTSKRSVPSVDHKAGLFLRKILGFPFSLLNSPKTNGRFKKYYRELIFPRMTTEKIPQAPSRRYNSKLHRSFASKKAGMKRKHFSEILDEVARSKKQNGTSTEKSDKGNQL